MLDSESTDGSAEFLREQPVEFDSLAQGGFRPWVGFAIVLAQGARGRFLVFLSQDALPVGTDFLECLTAPLEDEVVAGVWARNLPRPDDDALTRRSLLSSVESGEAGRRVRLPEGRCLADLDGPEAGGPYPLQ